MRKTLTLENELVGSCRMAGAISTAPEATLLARERGVLVARGIDETAADEIARASLTVPENRKAAIERYKQDQPRDFLPQSTITRLEKRGPIAVYKEALRHTDSSGKLQRVQEKALNRVGLTLRASK
jgi:hypothetical protein